MEFLEKTNQEVERIVKRLSLRDLSEILYFPKYFEIETIRACNARCNMCPVWQNPEKNGIMSDELFEKIVEELENYSDWVNVICLSRNGEPLLDKKLEEKIKLLKKIDIKNVSFSTNASLLDEERAIALIESGLDDIRFSIDGFTKETFESIRQGLDFDRVVKNCLRFIRLRDERGVKPRIQVRMVLQDKNEHEEEGWNKFWSEKVSEYDKVVSKRMNNWGNQLVNYSRDNEKEKYADVPCISPFSTMIILFDGKIPLCGVDYDIKHLLGDINKGSIKNVWNSEEFNKIREMHSLGNRNDISLCIGCNIWDLDEKKVYNLK